MTNETTASEREQLRSIHSRAINLGAAILAQRYWGDRPTLPQAQKQDDALADLGMEARKLADAIAAARAALPAPADQVSSGSVRILRPGDAYCPKCGHNRDASSVSSIAHEDGRRSCQLCDADWMEKP